MALTKADLAQIEILISSKLKPLQEDITVINTRLESLEASQQEILAHQIRAENEYFPKIITTLDGLNSLIVKKLQTKHNNKENRNFC